MPARCRTRHMLRAVVDDRGAQELKRLALGGSKAGCVAGKWPTLYARRQRLCSLLGS